LFINFLLSFFQLTEIAFLIHILPVSKFVSSPYLQQFNTPIIIMPRLKCCSVSKEETKRFFTFFCVFLLNSSKVNIFWARCFSLILNLWLFHTFRVIFSRYNKTRSFLYLSLPHSAVICFLFFFWTLFFHFFPLYFCLHVFPSSSLILPRLSVNTATFSTFSYHLLSVSFSSLPISLHNFYRFAIIILLPFFPSSALS